MSKAGLIPKRLVKTVWTEGKPRTPAPQTTGKVGVLEVNLITPSPLRTQ